MKWSWKKVLAGIVAAGELIKTVKGGLNDRPPDRPTRRDPDREPARRKPAGKQSRPGID